MARSRLTETRDDLISDSGSVLWSFVRGEQLEYPVTLSFLANAYVDYEFEAVVIEADNFEGQLTRPTSAKAGGVQTKLTVRTPPWKGAWEASKTYIPDDVVSYEGKGYEVIANTFATGPTPPDVSDAWEEVPLNTVYLQFESTLGADWAVMPLVGSPVYGFFELRVTEPPSIRFRRTWKPARGMVELHFSPTDIVPD